MKGRIIPYTDEELAWIKAHSTEPRRQMHLAFCAKFGRDDASLSNLNSLCKRKGWMTGRTGCFAPDQTPYNKGKKMPFNANSAATQFKPGERRGIAQELYKPIGTERRSKEGYLERKIHNGMPLQSRWRAVHLIEWEAVNGPVPKDHCLKCLDGDRTNTAAANWTPIRRALLPRLSGGRWYKSYDDHEPEVRPAVLALARLEHAVREARKP